MVLAAGRGEYVLCQVTSNPYGDPRSVEFNAADFSSGSLQLTSYARPGKLFTASEHLIVRQVGVLAPAMLDRIVEAVILLLRGRT
ncbi:MAG TPA: hypothetical protein VFS20_16580 [Longimicrobium sp.]|nr:hypothetical protein [Longimicrobium sp.]